LGRVLGVADRAVGAVAEPLRMLFEPGMVERALDGEIERDLQAVFGGGGDQPAEILGRAERRVDRIVSAFDAADGIGAAGIVGPGLQCIVAALAVGRADGMDRREIEDVEAHVANAGKALVTSSNVPRERGKSSYQLANSACGRSTSTAMAAWRQEKARSSASATRRRVSL